MTRKDGWSSLELNILKNRWDSAEPSEWIHLLPNRTYYSIKTKARRLKLVRNLSKYSKKNTFKCSICKKIFLGYGNRAVCSRKCLNKYMGITRVGKNNPYYNDNKEIKTNCKKCGVEFTFTRSGHRKNKTQQFCTAKCSRDYQVRENAANWLGGISLLPYSIEFNNKLKNQIKLRDNNKCVLCGNKNKLCVHHIDYDKMNSNYTNLITLCKVCHGSTNVNRVFWQHVFEFIMSKYTIIPKGWGFEFIPVTNKHFCLKALVFFMHKKFSDHYHIIKKESWYCLVGKMHAKIIKSTTDTEELIFKQGDVLDIYQEESHQLFALEPTILLEVSTKDSSDDSYRIKRGD